MLSPRIRLVLYFLAGFLPAWLVEATKYGAAGTTPQGFLQWSLVVAGSLIPGIAAVIAALDSSTPTANR